MAYLKAVSPSLLSNDCFRPDIRPLPSQTSVGYYLVRTANEKDFSYGVHFTEYGGIGDLTILGEIQKNEPVVPRSHLHFGDGSMASSKNSKIPHDVLSREVDRNKAWWIQKPGEDSQYLHSLSDKYLPRTVADPYFSTKSKFIFFPRSKKFDMEYMKEAEKEVNAESNAKMSENCEESLNSENDQDNNMKGRELDSSKRNSDAFDENSEEEIPKSTSNAKVVTKFTETGNEKEDTNLFPGSDFQQAIQQTCTCAEKVDAKKKPEISVHEMDNITVQECRNIIRQQEMSRVGLPYKSGKCQWFNELYKTEKLPLVGRTEKRQFEFKHFTNL